MIKIGGTWHYEPEKGELNGLHLCRMLRIRGHDIRLKDIRERRDEVMDIYYKEYGRGPAPVPLGVMINLRVSEDTEPPLA